MSKYKILILEDDDNRIVYFRRNLYGHDVIVTKFSKEAIGLLKKFKFDVLFLDHDLGGKQMVAPGENTGSEVAEWLNAHPDRQPPSINIHSYNPDGAKNMHRLLPGSILCPGVWLTDMSAR